MFLQRTIRKTIEVHGIGLHTGKKASLKFSPAPVNTGIYFIRNDLKGKPSVAAKAEFVKATSMATTIGCPEFSISTVEHCLSTLAALRIDNLFIELDGPEIPIGDGSAHFFLEAILEAGVAEQDQPRLYAYVTQPIYCGDSEKHAYAVPYNGLRITCTIEFAHPSIGYEKLDIDVNEHSFNRELAKARTFGFLKDAENMRRRGLALGASLENAIVLDTHEVMNPEGLRFVDEFVRHKVLDALGDLVTLGHPFMGHLILHKAGHDLMNKLIRKMIASPDSLRFIELGANLPSGVEEYNLLWSFT